MVDIAMCYNGGACPLKESCFRFIAKPSAYQTMGSFYKPEEDGECTHYWEVKSETEYHKLMEAFDD